MTIKIEITNKPDVKQLAATHAACFPKSWDVQSIAQMLSIEGTYAFVVPGNKGFGLLRHISGEAEILTIAILPPYIRQGLGGAIISAMRAWAKEQGIEALFLEVAESNEAARHLYHKAGFLLLSRRKAYYQSADGSLEDALIMRHTLS